MAVWFWKDFGILVDLFERIADGVVRLYVDEMVFFIEDILWS